MSLSRKEQIYNAASNRFNNEYHRDCFMEGAEWADSHPNGFINYKPKKDLTNKEFIELLKQFPEDANVCIECCSPRAMVYDEEDNLIRID